jgi:hypothetical protein
MKMTFINVSVTVNKPIIISDSSTLDKLSVETGTV